jgi:hypothetical protein
MALPSSIWLSVTVTQTVIGNTTFRVSFLVLAGGIPSDLFVLRVEDDGFSHAALPADINFYPSSKVAAQDQGLAFYRVNGVTVDWTSKLDAATFTEDVLSRLSFTRNAWAEAEDVSFGGVKVVTYPSP